MTRTTLTLLGVLGLASLPTPAAAQTPGDLFFNIVPRNPRFSMPNRVPLNLGLSVTPSPNGGISGSVYVGVGLPNHPRVPTVFTPASNYGYYAAPTSAWAPLGTNSSGYISGGGLANDPFAAAQRQLALAQRNAGLERAAAAPEVARDVIGAQWAYEKLGLSTAPAVKAAKNHPEALQRALGISQEADAASGEALNHILVAVVAAEGRGGKGPSAFLPPHLLDEVRFAGGNSADALNLVRHSGKLPFPAAFDAPALKDARAALEKDFAAAAAPWHAGKPADPVKLTQLEVTLRKAQTAAAPVVRNLAFEDAKAARKFLNQLDNTLTALRTPANNGLVNPTWATDGVNVADLVKHMTKYRLLFGPAPVGREDVYLALHKGLATYLFVLTQKK